MEQLVTRVRNGDHKAFRELYELFSKPMYNLCLRMTGNADDAHDVLQDSFVKVFEHIGQLKQPATLPAWIKRICTNTAILALNQRKKLQFEELDGQTGLFNRHEEEGWIRKLELEQDLAAINEAIRQLPDRYRVVFTMHVLEDYTHEEIAGMLGIVAGTSRSQYLRAKQKLMDILKKNKNHVRPVETIPAAIQIQA
ncbi:MAG TPA: RNA polymerase sigma factor [Saprospiraceae bacterium]|nr:RNA polymerase sigma factor [Saprospiraceae bacterium]